MTEKHIGLPQFFHVRISETVLLPVHVLQDVHRQKRMGQWYTANHEQELHILIRELLRDVLFEKRTALVASRGSGRNKRVENNDNDDDGEKEEEDWKRGGDGDEEVEEVDSMSNGDDGGSDESSAEQQQQEECFKRVMSTSRSLEVRRGKIVRFTYQFKETAPTYVFIQRNPFYKHDGENEIDQLQQQAKKKRIVVDESDDEKEEDVIDLCDDIVDSDLLSLEGVEMETIIPASQNVLASKPIELDLDDGEEVEPASAPVSVVEIEEGVQGVDKHATTGGMDVTAPPQELMPPTDAPVPQRLKRKRDARSLKIDYINSTQRYKSFRISPYSLYVYADQWNSSQEQKLGKQHIGHYFAPCNSGVSNSSSNKTKDKTMTTTKKKSGAKKKNNK